VRGFGHGMRFWGLGMRFVSWHGCCGMRFFGSWHEVLGVLGMRFLGSWHRFLGSWHEVSWGPHDDECDE